MNYPTSTNPDEWGAAFGAWIQDSDAVFNEDSMAEWFEAAFKASREAGRDSTETGTVAPPAPVVDSGVWVSYYLDRSAVVPFGDELTALRHAVNNSCDAKFVPFGTEVLEA